MQWPFNKFNPLYTRHLTLENELQILLVSDPITEKAAASLAVRVGELISPSPLPHPTLSYIPHFRLPMWPWWNTWSSSLLWAHVVPRDWKGIYMYISVSVIYTTKHYSSSVNWLINTRVVLDICPYLSQTHIFICKPHGLTHCLCTRGVVPCL